MKIRTIAIIAGFSGSLLLGSRTEAAFVGLTTEVEVGDTAYLVGRVYANFNNPNDVMVAVAGTPGNPMMIKTWAEFYQNPFGSDTAPNPALIPVFPSLAEDTFVTIGKSTSIGDQTGLTPGWPGFTATSLAGTNLGWFITPDEPQGVPIDGRVLLGQFSVLDIGPDPNVEGTFLLAAVSDGDPNFQASVFFSFLIPAPGSLALLGIGLIGPRRRRTE